MFDESSTKFTSPNDSLQNKLFKMVLLKTISWMSKLMYLEIKVKMELLDLDFHFFHMLNLIMFSTKKQINGNIINHNMKIDMLSHIIQHCYCYGVFIWIFYILHLHIGHFIYENMTWNVNHMEH
jgi:hypothetical protein